MKVSVNREKCQGHGRCYLTNPEAFDVDDDYGHSIVILPNEMTDDPKMQERVSNAADSCPEDAIVID